LLLLTTAGFGGLRAYAGRRSEKELATRIGPLAAGAEIACFRCFPEGLTWYRESPVTVISAGGSPEEIRSNYMLFLWKRRELSSSVLVDPARLDAWLAGRNRPVLVIGHDHVRGSLEALAAPRKLAVTRITSKWWGVLIPAARGGG
jgi:hypothetical protein